MFARAALRQNSSHHCGLLRDAGARLDSLQLTGFAVGSGALASLVSLCSLSPSRGAGFHCAALVAMRAAPMLRHCELGAGAWAAAPRFAPRLLILMLSVSSPSSHVPERGLRCSPEEWEAARAAAEASMRRGGGLCAVMIAHDPEGRWEAHGGCLQLSGDDA